MDLRQLCPSQHHVLVRLLGLGLLLLSIFGVLAAIQDARGGLHSAYATGQAEVADLDGAVFVDEDVGGLEVSVEDVG